MFDGKAFGEQMVEIVKGYVEAQLAPLQEQVRYLENRLRDLEEQATTPGKDGGG